MSEADCSQVRPAASLGQWGEESARSAHLDPPLMLGKCAHQLQVVHAVAIRDQAPRPTAAKDGFGPCVMGQTMVAAGTEESLRRAELK